MWQRLSVAIAQIQRHNISQLSYEEHYRYAYNLILGAMLYAGVRREVQEHLARQCDEQLVSLFALDAQAARIADALLDKGKGKEVDGEMTAALGLLPASPASAAILASIPAGERFLHAVAYVWDDHCSCMGKLRDVLKYVDRVYVPNHHLQPIWELGMDLFRDTVVRRKNVPMWANLLVTLLRQIYCEREGASVERRTIKSVADMLLALTHASPQPTKHTVYEKDFAPVFLHTTAAYYRAESVRLLATHQATHYLGHVERRLAEEEARVAACLSPATLPALRTTLETHLLTDHLDTVIGMPDGGLVALLRADQRAELAQMYRLVKLVPTGLPVLNKAMRAYATEHGRAINEASNAPTRAADGAASVPTAELAVAWVNNVLAFKTQFDTILYASFQGDKTCEAAMNEAFDSFINMNPRAAEFISLFIDEHLKKGTKTTSDEEMEAVLDKTITIFRFVHEKDMFERYYKLHLTRRLLHGRSVSDDAERGLVAKLKVECGHGYVQKLQGMLNDMKLSQEILASFHKALDRKAAVLPFQMNVHVLTAVYWPITTPKEACILPRQLTDACGAFDQFYGTRHRGRVLAWQPSFGTAELRVRFQKRTHELVLSTYALIVLLLFEHVLDGQALSYTDIKTSTRMPDGDLQRTLQSLACAKYKILRKEPHSRDVASTDRFFFHHDFTCPLARIKIAQVAAKPETPSERKETTAKVEEERKNQVDACVVRVMKNRKTLPHNELVNEVARQLAPRFQPTPSLIKRRIEALLEREFLERTDDRDVYQYVA